jgi:hypothetical protein
VKAKACFSTFESGESDFRRLTTTSNERSSPRSDWSLTPSKIHSSRYKIDSSTHIPGAGFGRLALLRHWLLYFRQKGRTLELIDYAPHYIEQSDLTSEPWEDTRLLLLQLIWLPSGLRPRCGSHSAYDARHNISHSLCHTHSVAWHRHIIIVHSCVADPSVSIAAAGRNQGSRVLLLRTTLNVSLRE